MYLWLDMSGQWLLFAVIASLCVLQETFAGLCQQPSVSKSPTATTCSASVAVTGHFWNTHFLGSVLGEFISKQQLI